MDIEKLQKLSCLELKPEQKEKIAQSLGGVLDMMSAVEALGEYLAQIETQALPVLMLIPDQLRTSDSSEPNESSEDRSSNLISKTNTDLNLQDGYFLAPKAIKR